MSPVDISNSGVSMNPTIFQRKFSMARIALKRSDFIKTISSDDFPSQFVVHKKMNTLTDLKGSTSKLK